MLFIPGGFILPYGQQSVIDGFIAQCINGRYEKVEGIQQQFAIFCQWSLGFRVAGEFLLQLWILLGQIGECIGQGMLCDHNMMEMWTKGPCQPQYGQVFTLCISQLLDVCLQFGVDGALWFTQLFEHNLTCALVGRYAPILNAINLWGTRTQYTCIYPIVGTSGWHRRCGCYETTTGKEKQHNNLKSFD